MCRLATIGDPRAVRGYGLSAALRLRVDHCSVAGHHRRAVGLRRHTDVELVRRLTRSTQVESLDRVIVGGVVFDGRVHIGSRPAARICHYDCKRGHGIAKATRNLIARDRPIPRIAPINAHRIGRQCGQPQPCGPRRRIRLCSRRRSQRRHHRRYGHDRRQLPPGPPASADADPRHAFRW